MPYAHSRNDRGERHDLIAHLDGVADKAARFGGEFGAGEAARLLGLWHDVGKFNPAFQDYLLACETDGGKRRRGPDHKGAGAVLAERYLSLCALAAQGHHGGLKTPTELQTWLAERKADGPTSRALAMASAALPDLTPAREVPLPSHVQGDARAAELFVRLIFSALVDADYLDTEEHFASQTAARRGSDAGMAALWKRFDAAYGRFAGGTSDTVVQARREVYLACLAAAELPPGIFRLSAPTGGGKTLSGMAFALRHALRHGQRRVIVAVPFISITEQTADVYRDIFRGSGDSPVVLEHHSAAASRAGADEDFDLGHVWARLAAENWDAPIVVTTTVQLFESLFENGTSGSRKVHNMARSVIILDEAQALPAHLLAPILDVLRELTAHYGTTVVISTATQPAFEAIPIFRDVPAREIVPDPGRLFATLRRVTYEWHTDRALPWIEVADLLRDEQQALAVVNTKKDALALLDALDDPAALHLSTMTCGAHRRAVIAEVRCRLEAGELCRLVSTQVIESGIDLDFPLVLRALGPLDGIIQAAGRCNRNGRIARGRVVVFRAEGDRVPPGTYRIARDVTAAMLGGGGIDPDDPAVARAYFKRLFETVNTDERGIEKLRQRFDYPKVASEFRMIDDETTVNVTVRYGSKTEQQEVQGMLERLRLGTPDARRLLRRLQPYLVSLRGRAAERYERMGLIVPVVPGVGEWLGAYDRVRGLVGHDLEPDALVL